MSVGIDRKYFGDLLATDAAKAYFPFWNKADIYRHLFDNFSQCGNAKISLSVVDKNLFDSLELKFEEKEIILSSLRADCFLSAITGASRTQAKKLIEAGEFKISSHPILDSDVTLKQGCVFSVRGFGKYKFDSVIGATRKERIRVKLLKYGSYTERIL